MEALETNHERYIADHADAMAANHDTITSLVARFQQSMTGLGTRRPNWKRGPLQITRDTINDLEEKVSLLMMHVRDIVKQLENRGSIPDGEHWASFDIVEQMNEELKKPPLQAERDQKADIQFKLDKLDSDNLALPIDNDANYQCPTSPAKGSQQHDQKQHGKHVYHPKVKAMVSRSAGSGQSSMSLTYAPRNASAIPVARADIESSSRPKLSAVSLGTNSRIPIPMGVPNGLIYSPAILERGHQPAADHTLMLGNAAALVVLIADDVSTLSDQMVPRAVNDCRLSTRPHTKAYVAIEFLTIQFSSNRP
ncbi:hypothetical protein PTT_16713 [Pyrenophora teres f. teres 0-1]|uniref:Uncharacterized protein n=1 Tax=Pyrenophora teres f. teres (strain 0-1) TaxID=861557 RepID=E3S2W2_PYRTT|nr:hypothetical protein PTT_16713 [Pyrenophora teres f. teres 0-1]